MARTAVLHDVMHNYIFDVRFSGFDSSAAGFQKVTGLKQSIEMIEYREGNGPLTNRKMPGRPTYDDVTFDKGMTSDLTVFNWAISLYNAKSFETETSAQFRREILVTNMDRYVSSPGAIVEDAAGGLETWHIANAWVKEYSFDDLDASANSALIEHMVVCHEGVFKEYDNRIKSNVEDSLAVGEAG